jgi:hypothetical protein
MASALWCLWTCLIVQLNLGTCPNGVQMACSKRPWQIYNHTSMHAVIVSISVQGAFRDAAMAL